MKHQLKSINTQSTNIPGFFGVDREVHTKLNIHLTAELIHASFQEDSPDDINDVFLAALDSFKTEWTPKSIEDYLMIGYAYASAKEDLSKVKKALTRDKPGLFS